MHLYLRENNRDRISSVMPKVRKLAPRKRKVVKKIKEDRKRSNIIKPPPRTPEDTRPIIRKTRQRIEEELLRACIAEGMNREEIMVVMNLREDQIAIIEKRLLANDGQKQLAMTTAHRYYVYTLQQEQCLRDLDYFVEETYRSIKNWNNAARLYGSPGVARKILGTAPSPQAAVIAIKAKSEILDRTIKTGQDMGVIQKRAKEVRVSGQLNLAALPTEQLRKTLQKKLSQFDELVAKGTLPKMYINMLEQGNDGRESVFERREGPQPILDGEFEEVVRPVDGESS